MANATKPPYATLTAYDLNKGTIKWQVPVGDDPATIANGGPTEHRVADVAQRHHADQGRPRVHGWQ